MITTRHALGWILATALVTLTAWWVVAAASGEVNEVSGAPVVVPTTSTSTGIGSSSSLTSTSTSLAPTSTVSSDATTSTSTGGSNSTTATTASGVETISSAGGTVTVSYGNGQVQLQGASPAFGYSMEIEKTGPDEVRVDFESDNNDISVRVKWENGKLAIEIND